MKGQTMRTIQTDLEPMAMSDCNGKEISVGAIMRFNQRGHHLRRLRDDYLGRMNSDRAMRKQWYEDALAKRFRVTAFGQGPYCAEIWYEIIGSSITGACMANELEIA